MKLVYHFFNSLCDSLPRILHCKNCGFRTYDDRDDDEEIVDYPRCGEAMFNDDCSETGSAADA